MIDRNMIPSGYTGKILRVDLTTETASEISTYQYVPDYIGGKGIATKIFYDEVGPKVKAYDPENLLIYMSGPACGTGLPNASRGVFCSISPKTLPEMFTWSGIGGFFAEALKFAGYDGVVIKGKAKKHTYIVIDDGKVEFRDADEDGLWGQFTRQTQEMIFDRFGRDYFSQVIGPAGENMMRYASITTSADNVAAKTGFGAVMGSKNLKAIVAHGTGDITVGNLEEIMKLRGILNDFDEIRHPNPIQHANTFGAPEGAPEGAGQTDYMEYDLSWLSCCPGCTMRCNKLTMNCNDPFENELFNLSTKCVDLQFPVTESDCFYWLGEFIGTKYNSPSIAKTFYGAPADPSDPDFALINSADYGGGKLNYWKFDFDRGNKISYLCNAYGIDKWEVAMFYMTWISACKQEGILGELPFDFGKEPEISFEFLDYFLDCVVYRKTEWGELFADGMSRVIRKLGKKKWGNTIFHNQFNRKGEQLDIPVSLEMAWGGSAHWIGRGYQRMNEPQALMGALQVMVSTRDSQTNAHQHTRVEDWLQFKDDPYHSPLMAKCLEVNEVYGEIKESILSCEWTHHQPYREDEEVRMFNAATGYQLTEEEFFRFGQKIKGVYRAIEMRNHGRIRDIEVEEVYPIMSFPNYDKWAPTWDDWNDAVDLYYKQLGWDIATGWPLKETWEALGLDDVAEEMKKLGKIPDPKAAYIRKESPFTVDGHFRPED